MALYLGYLADGVVIRVVGRGTLEESPAFRAAATTALASGRVVCDATDCEYLDSTFLGCLIGVKKESERQAGTRFEIAADAQAQIKLFSTSSLDRFFDFIDTAPQPVGELVPIEGDPLDTAALGQHVLECHRRLAHLGGHEAGAFRRVVKRLEEELGRRTGTDRPRA